MKSEFVLDDSRIEEHRSSNTINTNRKQPPPNAQTSKSLNTKTDASHKLKAVSQENAAHKKGPNSKEVPNTVASKILTHVVANEHTNQLQHSPSKGKIIVQNSQLLQDNAVDSGGIEATATTTKSQSRPSGLSLPVGVARQKPLDAGSEETKNATTVFKAKAQPPKALIPTKKTETKVEQSVQSDSVSKTQISKGVTKEMVDRLQNAISANSNQSSKTTPKTMINAVSKGNAASSVTATKTGTGTAGPKKPTVNAKPTNLNNVNKSNVAANKTSAALTKGKPQQGKITKPATQTTQNKPAPQKASPRKPMNVAKINTNMLGSSVQSPRRPDRPLTRQVSYGSRSSSSENFKLTPPQRKSSDLSKEKTTLNSQQKKGHNVARQSSSSSDDFTPVNEAVLTPRPKPSDTSPKQQVKIESKSAAVNKVSPNQTVAESSKSSSAKPGLKSGNKNDLSSTNQNANNNASQPVKLGEPPVVRHPPKDRDIQWPPSRENVIKTEVKQPFMGGARAYQPLHMLMNSSMIAKNKQNESIIVNDEKFESNEEDFQVKLTHCTLPT